MDHLPTWLAACQAMKQQIADLMGHEQQREIMAQPNPVMPGLTAETQRDLEDDLWQKFCDRHQLSE